MLSKARNGKFHFSLNAGNGEIIATSQMYNTKSGALNGIESVKKNAADATVDDQSDKPAEWGGGSDFARPLSYLARASLKPSHAR